MGGVVDLFGRPPLVYQTGLNRLAAGAQLMAVWGLLVGN
jgi:hypothetical protein